MIDRILALISPLVVPGLRHHIAPEATFSELRLDTIDRAAVSMEIEDEFGVSFTDEQVQAWECLADIERMTKRARN
jgi:acyl carrier protein